MIYLDANATSRLRPEAAQVVQELASADGARNPSSVHRSGRAARTRLTAARKAVLELLNHGAEIRGQRLVFTSGGTESCNQLVFGFLGPLPQLTEIKGSIVVSAIEHPAMLEPIALLERCGWTVKRINPTPEGIVRVSDFLAAVQPDTALVSLMAANNETGIIQPVAELAGSLRAINYRGAIISDFTQAFGKTSLTISELFDAGVTAVSISGHKIGAPTGIGAFVINEAKSDVCLTFEPLLRGGAQEGGHRAGTENLLGAVAFGEVSRTRLETLGDEMRQQNTLREMLWELLRRSVNGVERITPRNEDKVERSLCNTLLVRFAGCRGDDLVVALDLEGVAASTGSACSSGKQQISHVAQAMGFPPEKAREVIRFSLDWDTDEAAIESAARIVARAVQKMKGRSAPSELAAAA